MFTVEGDYCVLIVAQPAIDGPKFPFSFVSSHDSRLKKFPRQERINLWPIDLAPHESVTPMEK